MEYLSQHIESLIFTCEHPITFNEMQAALEETFETTFKEEDLVQALEELMERHQSDQSSFEIVKIAGGYQFLTKGAFHATVGTFLKQTIKKRLSKAALETLAIVAYKQPVSKGDIESIRGVNCDYAMQKLLEKELITITGRSDAPGRPLLYGTSHKFMDYFGIQSLNDLPKLKEFQHTENSIGEAAPIEEEISTDTHRPEEDDVVSLAIAIADLFDPVPPLDERDSIKNTEEESEEAGTAAADAPHNPLEENHEAAELPEVDENTNETTEEGSISEFVTLTSGEFTGDQLEQLAKESLEEDNHSASENVVIEEETAPIKED